MAKTTFSVRQLLLAITAISVALSVLVFLARNAPDLLHYAFVYTCSIGLSGFGFVLLAAAIYFIVDSKDEQQLKKAKCLNLTFIGLAMISMPILTGFATFVLLPLLRPT